MWVHVVYGSGSTSSPGQGEEIYHRLRACLVDTEYCKIEAEYCNIESIVRVW
jgi:hypothetical protein